MPSQPSFRYALDTPQGIERIHRQQVGAMNPSERALLADRLSRDVVAAAKAGIIASGRFRSSEQVHEELVRRLHGDVVADEYFKRPAS